MTDGLDRKEFATMQARFARRGYELRRVFQVGTAQPSYQLRRNAQTRIFAHLHLLLAHLEMAEGLPALGVRQVPKKLADYLETTEGLAE